MVNRLQPIIQTQQPTGSNASQAKPRVNRGFDAALARETELQRSLKISSHAQKRLNSSQIELTDSDMERIDGAVQKADEKGSNQSLVMLDNLALVVSIKNKVVITAVDDARAKDGVFTNIDSVVIA